MTTHIVGLAIPVGSLSMDLGGFREVISAEALDPIFTDDVDLRLLVDHDPAKVMARRSAGTLALYRDARGLHVVGAVDPEISYTGDVVRAVKRGDISGMSFAFAVEHVSWAERDGEPVRTVHSMRTRETSVVTWPAYGSTNVSVQAARSTMSPPGRCQETTMHDESLEVAAPGPGQRRDIALAELEQAKRWWATHPGRPLELRYGPPRRSHAINTAGMSIKMRRNIQRQVEATL